MSKNVVIIKGGIGGLVTACLLCEEEFTTTILERNYKIDGRLQENGMVRKIFSYISKFIETHIQNKQLQNVLAWNKVLRKYFKK